MNISQLNGNPFADVAFRKYIETEGAVIFSFNDEFSPADLWGGSWEKVENRFIIGASQTFPLGTTGGATAHRHGLASGYAEIVLKGDRITAATKKSSGEESWAATITTTDGLIGTYSVTWGTDESSKLGGETDYTTAIPPYQAFNIWVRN
jgi:hypothetical protein